MAYLSLSYQIFIFHFKDNRLGVAVGVPTATSPRLNHENISIFNGYYKIFIVKESLQNYFK